MPVQYDSKKIIPAPFVSISKEYQTTEDGRMIGAVYVLTVKGELVAYKGSPSSAGVFWTASGYPSDETLSANTELKAILIKQDAIRRLFSAHGKSFEIQPLDGSAPLKCNPRIRNITFPEGNWFVKSEFTITLEADELLLNGTPIEQTEFANMYISKASNDWNVEIMDEDKKTFRLTHNVSAVGKTHYETDGTIDKLAWERAKDYVTTVIGLGADLTKVSGSVIANWVTGGLAVYNYMRSQSTNELGGVYSVTETWICFDPLSGPPATDECNVSVKSSATDTGKYVVSVEGTVAGLERRDPTTGILASTKWTNAAAKFATIDPLSRAETISGITLNSTPVSSSIGNNQQTGVVSYHYEYDNRPVSDFTDAISQLITVHNSNSADVFARVTVLGRALGPILQDIGTQTERKRQISIEIQMKPKTVSFAPSAPDTIAAVLARKPAVGTVFLEGDEESFVEETGRYSRQTTYVWSL